MNDVIQLTASIKEIVNDGLKSLPKGAEIIADAAKFIGDSIQQAMEFEKIAKSIETLTGSRNGGTELMANLKELEKTTILGSGVYKDAQAMLSRGIGSTEIIKDLKQIGDVAMGDEEHVAALSLAFAKTHEAGKLIGEDLKEYANAGFNPLKMMSEHWQEFGLKQKASISQLKEMMEAGKISADMVAKSFEVATSKGGQFYQAMEQAGETTYGQMQRLKSNWSSMQTDIGNALVPITSGVLDLGNNMLNTIGIIQTMPEALASENLEIHSLINSITQLNQGNELRGKMIDILKVKYPGLFGNIDKEKTENSELLSKLKEVNAEYERRINLAGYKYVSEKNKEDANTLIDLSIKARSQIEYNKTHKGIFEGNRYFGITDKLRADMTQVPYGRIMDLVSVVGLIGSDSKVLEEYANKAEAKSQELLNVSRQAEENAKIQQQINLRSDVIKLANDPGRQKELWGDNVSKNFKEFSVQVADWNKLYKANGNRIAGTLLTHDWTKLNDLLKGDTVANDSNDGGRRTSGKSSEISSGGVRAVTINLGKFFDNFTINTQTINEGIDHLDNAVAESLLRVMNSAAKARE